MEKLIERMIRKRLCLSYNTNIDDIKYKVNNNGENYMHISCIFTRNFKILSYGMNLYTLNSYHNTIHSEVKALLNLKIRRKSNYERVNILIIRVSPTGKLGISKPCLKCVEDLNELSKKRGYIIDKILYSTNEENIENTTLNKLLYEVEEGNYHISKYYRLKNNFK